MVDEGEFVTMALKREFREEAGSINTPAVLEEIFSNPIVVYRGYSDDYRNTDNAWIETTCALFFPTSNCRNLRLKEDGSETLCAAWKPFDDIDTLNLFSSHRKMLQVALHVAQSMATRT